MFERLPAPNRRRFLQRLAGLGVACSISPWAGWRLDAAGQTNLPDPVLGFPGPWQFQLPKGQIILVSDQQLKDLQDPDQTVDLSLSTTPQPTTLRKICEQTKAAGGHSVVLAFDEFWSQYRPGQGGRPRELTPDTVEFLTCVARISQTLRGFGLGLELSLLSPLEIGRGYTRATGESGIWVQYREGYRDPATGKYSVSLWEQQRWTNNKGTVRLERLGVRVFAFREQRVGRTSFYAVNPSELVELPPPNEWDADESALTNTQARRVTLRGRGGPETARGRDRVLVVVRYAVPEMDYFSPQALPFLKELVSRCHTAKVPLRGLYADEMHIQQDWGYDQHHDVGQFAFRYLTPHLARCFAERHGPEFADLEKFLVYFCYGQHDFRPDLDARLPAQHVLGARAEDIQRTWLLRRRYFELLQRGVVDLFVQAKAFAEQLYGCELEARAHATWAQSPTCDFWHTGNQPSAPRRYEYTPDFLWSNTVHQAASACEDYFEWNRFLTGGGNDHAEGGWSDRNYYGIALACSTGLLNRVPYAYAAAWGMPLEAWRRRQAVCDAFGAAASPWFQAVQDSQHRDIEVLMLYPLSLVAAEERFGSWMTQYGYANYVTPRVLVERSRLTDAGQLEMAGRRFGTVAVLFEPLPPPELLPLLERFAAAGGRVIWSGPPPRIDLAGEQVLARWQQLFGVQHLAFGLEGLTAPGRTIQFQGPLAAVPPQTVLTDFLVDQLYPVVPGPQAEGVALMGTHVLGALRRFPGGGSATFLGFRPRDDQSGSLGQETRTWFEVLRALDAYPRRATHAPVNDNPAVVSRTTPYVACRFPNGTTALAAHYRNHEESWPGGFHRDAAADREALARNPLPPGDLNLVDFCVNGHRLSYQGALTVAFRMGSNGALEAFAGHECRGIAIDGKEQVLADGKLALLAWAPVPAARRVSGGAILELWAHAGTGTNVSVPLPAGISGGRLFLAGSRPGSLDRAVESVCENGRLRFEARPEWPRHHLYLLPG